MVTTVVVLQVVGNVNVITDVPADTPDTTPVADATVAMPGEPEVHVPLPLGSDKDVVVPGQAVSDPVMVAGNGFITITADPVMALLQPVVGLVASTV